MSHARVRAHLSREGSTCDGAVAELALEREHGWLGAGRPWARGRPQHSLVAMPSQQLAASSGDGSAWTDHVAVHVAGHVAGHVDSHVDGLVGHRSQRPGQPSGPEPPALL